MLTIAKVANRWSRYVAIGSIGLMLALALPASTPTVAHASTPVFACGPSNDGELITNSEGIWECRCRIVSGGTDIFCEWILAFEIEDESLANHLFTSAELGYTGAYYAMLRARANNASTWERYTLGGSGDSNGTWSLRSTANNLYVSTELGYTGSDQAMLRARASVIGPWEEYYLYDLGGGAFALQSATNGLYVSAELGYTGANYAEERARATAVGPWEQYALPGSFGLVAKAARAQAASPCAGASRCRRLIAPIPNMSARRPG